MSLSQGQANVSLFFICLLTINNLYEFSSITFKTKTKRETKETYLNKNKNKNIEDREIKLLVNK